MPKPGLASSSNRKKHAAPDEALGYPTLPKKVKGLLFKLSAVPKAAAKALLKFKVTVTDAKNDDDNDNKKNKVVDPSHTGCEKGMKNYTI